MPNRKNTYSKLAAKDLLKTYQDTVKEWGIAQADKYDTELENTVNLLADNPDLGRNCYEIRVGLKRHEHDRHIISIASVRRIFLLFVSSMTKWM